MFNRDVSMIASDASAKQGCS